MTEVLVESRRAMLGDDREGMILPVVIEFRDEGDGAGADYFTMTGHASVFDSVSETIGGAFKEIMKPGCFRDALKAGPIDLLWQHNTDYPLASTDSRTLDVQEDGDGLRVWARIPKALSYAQDIRTLFGAGIARGMSFSFTTPKDGSGEKWTRMDDGTPLRTVHRTQRVYDVSPVTRGAYSAPAFSMRSLFEARATLLDAQVDPAVTLDPDAQADPAVVTLDAHADRAVRDTERSIRIAAMRADVALALCPER